MRHRAYLILAFLLLAACGNDDEFSTPRLLPDMFRIQGNATGSSGAHTIDCFCDLVVEIDTVNTESDGTLVYSGLHGGEFRRTVLDSTGAGIEVVPTVFGEVIIQQSPQGTVDLEFPANINTGVPFWDSVALFKGEISGELLSGVWTCAPFDIPQDSTGTVTGTWEVISF